jgi:hypothetical protein
MGYYDLADDEISEEELYELETKVEVLQDELNCTKEELTFYASFFKWVESSNRDLIQAWYALDKLEKA